MRNNQKINNSFESLLQDEAKNFRAFPSDHVWENIRFNIHGNNKWPALSFLFVTIVLALTIVTIFNYPPDKFLLNKNFVNKSSVVSKNLIAETKIQKHKNYIERENDKTVVLAFANFPTIQVLNISNVEVEENFSEQDVAANNKNFISEVEQNSVIHDEAILNNSNKEINSKQILIEDNASTIQPIPITDLKVNLLAKEFKMNSNLLVKNKIEFLNQFAKTSTPKKLTNNKWSIQYYATLSNSYRYLVDDKTRKDYLVNPIDRVALKNDVNNVVRHKPALGGEVGVSFLYGVTKNFFIKTGLQFNIRKYEMDAYLENGNAVFSYVQSNQLNSLSIKSNYTTQKGSTKTNLENKLYQISIPIGLQWDLINGSKWGLSAAATIQPTLTLNKNIYVVSTDYKYYADGNAFFRRFNINTSTELYVTLKSKNSKWFFGPQIRYQTLPTYNDLYPIKENRIDYGVKFGIIKSLN